MHHTQVFDSDGKSFPGLSFPSNFTGVALFPFHRQKASRHKYARKHFFKDANMAILVSQGYIGQTRLLVGMSTGQAQARIGWGSSSAHVLVKLSCNWLDWLVGMSNDALYMLLLLMGLTAKCLGFLFPLLHWDCGSNLGYQGSHTLSSLDGEMLLPLRYSAIWQLLGIFKEAHLLGKFLAKKKLQSIKIDN